MKTLKNYLILLLFLLLGYKQAHSQNVIASSGKQWTDQKIDVSWTIGEPVTFITELSYMVTQGFHQPELTISGIYKKPSVNILIEAYPNPTLGFIYLKIKGKTSLYQVEIINSEGKKIFSNEMQLGNDSQSIDFTGYPQGIYFVRVLTNQTMLLESFKVVKN